MTIKMATTTGSSGLEANAIYHELPPKLTWFVRVVNIVVVLMIGISVVLCFVQGHKDGAYYLLVCNLVISALVCIVVNWWYKNGDLGSEKYWFILLVGFVILLQCITSDIFLFKEESKHVPVTTTPRPHNTSVFPMSTMVTPVTRKLF